jgi:hypothetical protein
MKIQQNSLFSSSIEDESLKESKSGVFNHSERVMLQIDRYYEGYDDILSAFLFWLLCVAVLLWILCIMLFFLLLIDTIS